MIYDKATKTLCGSDASGGNLLLGSTTHATTKGKIITDKIYINASSTHLTLQEASVDKWTIESLSAVLRFKSPTTSQVEMDTTAIYPATDKTGAQSGKSTKRWKEHCAIVDRLYNWRELNGTDDLCGPWNDNSWHTIKTVALTDQTITMIRADIIGVESTYDGANYLIQGTWVRNGGTVTAVTGSTTTIVTHEDNAACDKQFAISGTNILIQAKGPGGGINNMHWVCTYDLMELVVPLA
jgi:hypothetical protein